jgi:opacity protein-like surface antigen
MTKKLALIVMFVLVFAASAGAQQVVRVKGNRTPLREEPSATSNLLTYYQMGTKLLALELVDRWYRVRDPQTQREGYIMATLVDLLDEFALPERAGKTPSQPGGVQTRPPAVRRPVAQAKPKVGVRAIADIGAVWMTASESFKAVTDTNWRMQYGGGLQVVNIWRGLYAEATVGGSQLSGSRVFVYQGTVYDLGIPTTITFVPIDAGAGWRFRHSRKVHSYIGGGVEFLKYKEESDFAEAGDNVDETFTGFYAAGGVEFLLAKWLHLRGEVRYTGVPNAIGAGGVSVDFNETDLGGVAAAVKLAIGK